MNDTIEELVKSQMDAIEQSFVPDPEDAENLNVTTNLDEWLEVTKQNDVFNKNPEGTGPNPDRVLDLYKQHQHHLNFDYEIIKNASGYILGPVFKINGKAECAASIVFDSLQEMKNFLKDKKYLLYYVLVSIKSKRLNIVDTDLFTIIPKRPMFRPMFGAPEIIYTFRGHILE